ncbi:MAG: hypothetical protein WED04_00365 [Promethearchaeati archaeon SRVP18_Atabeyarchaeia-1]
MDFLTLISKGVIPIIDFKSVKGDVKPFLAKYGGHVNAIGIVAKDDTGRAFFQTSVMPPGSPEQIKFLPSAAELFHSIGIKVYAIVSSYLDSRVARDPRLRTVNRFGKHNDKFACPTNVTNQNNTAKLLGELASAKLVDDIIVVDNGYVRKDYCFCDTCQKEFAQKKQLPLPITMDILNSKPGLVDDWIMWRAEVINASLDSFSKQVMEAASKVQHEVKFYGSVDMDERTRFMQGAFQNFGQEAEGIAKLTNVAIRVQPWTPIIPPRESKEYGKMLNDLRTISNTLNDYNHKGLILAWNMEDEDEISIAKDMAKALSGNEILSFQGFPASIGSQRDAHLGLDLEAR